MVRRFSNELAHSTNVSFWWDILVTSHFIPEFGSQGLVRRFSNELAHSTNVSHSGVRFGETFGETVRQNLFSKVALARLTIT